MIKLANLWRITIPGPAHLPPTWHLLSSSCVILQRRECVFHLFPTPPQYPPSYGGFSYVLERVLLVRARCLPPRTWNETGLGEQDFFPCKKRLQRNGDDTVLVKIFRALCGSASLPVKMYSIGMAMVVTLACSVLYILIRTERARKLSAPGAMTWATCTSAKTSTTFSVDISPGFSCLIFMSFFRTVCMLSSERREEHKKKQTETEICWLLFTD